MNNKFTDPLLHLNSLRKIFGFNAFASAISKQLKQQIIKEPPKGKVLILAPHPDDETFGCGGAIIKHLSQNDEIKLVFLASPESKDWETRTKEVKSVTDFLGLKDVEYISEMSGTDSIQSKIGKIVKDYQPKTVYVPSFLENHPDHFSAAKMFSQAICRVKYDGIILLYEIWTPIFVNRLLTIDDVIEKKKTAIGFYKSQLEDRDYLSAIIALNQYRGAISGAGKYAEGYLSLNQNLFQKLLNSYLLQNDK